MFFLVAHRIFYIFRAFVPSWRIPDGWFRNWFTSFSVGIDGCAPLLVTQIAEAAVANLAASIRSLPLLNLAARAPQKVSPAAVVSTATTLNAAIAWLILLFRTMHP